MMQDYDPKWSIVSTIDSFTYLCNTITILDLCLEQMASETDNLIPRLHYLITVVRADLDCFAKDGLFEAKVVRDFLYEHFPDEGDRTELFRSSKG